MSTFGAPAAAMAEPVVGCIEEQAARAVVARASAAILSIMFVPKVVEMHRPGDWRARLPDFDSTPARGRR